MADLAIGGAMEVDWVSIEVSSAVEPGVFPPEVLAGDNEAARSWLVAHPDVLLWLVDTGSVRLSTEPAGEA